jgi:hypothetical protein
MPGLPPLLHPLSTVCLLVALATIGDMHVVELGVLPDSVVETFPRVGFRDPRQYYYNHLWSIYFHLQAHCTDRVDM